jgi:hypothetical protein
MSESKKIAIEPDEAGLFWEARVSEALGVPRKILAALRATNLEAGPDFVRRENNAVALTGAGLAKVEKLLAGAGPDGQAPGKPGKTAGKPASSDVPAGPPPREMMTVDRVPQNPGLLLCQTHTRTAPVLVAVRVRENLNFAIGMTLEAIQSSDGVWQFHNRPTAVGGHESTVGRLPRLKGRW